jgi:hypothetical protein
MTSVPAGPSPAPHFLFPSPLAPVAALLLLMPPVGRYRAGRTGPDRAEPGQRREPLAIVSNPERRDIRGGGPGGEQPWCDLTTAAAVATTSTST